jgi:hypothetical protein
MMSERQFGNKDNIGTDFSILNHDKVTSAQGFKNK